MNFERKGGNFHAVKEGIQERYKRDKAICGRHVWYIDQTDKITKIDKVADKDKSDFKLNKDAKIGEEIFSQKFNLGENVELTPEYHGMEETIGVPDDSLGVNVQMDLYHPVTKRSETIFLRNAGAKEVIPTNVVHRTTNLGKEPVNLTARGIKTQEIGYTVKKPDIKEIFKPSDVAICIATRYEDWTLDTTDLSNDSLTKANLALGFLREAAYHGYRVVMADSGSTSAFLEEARKFPNVAIVEKSNDVNTLSKQKRAALEAAIALGDVKYIFKVEPEKVDAIRYIPSLIESIFQCQADVVVGQRRKEEFGESYPTYMPTIENKTNLLMNNHLRDNGMLPTGSEDLDLYSGMIAFRNTPQIVELFTTRFKPAPEEKIEQNILENWMNAQVFGVVLALHRGFKVRQIEIPFWYPRAKKLSETHPKLAQDYEKKRNVQQKVADDSVRFLAETLSGKHTYLVKE